MMVDAVCVPEVPVMVTGYVPGVAKLLTLNVSRLVEVAGLGAYVTVTLLGNPVAVRFTLPVNPVTVTVSVTLLPPGVVDRAAAEAVSLAFAVAGLMRRVMGVLELAGPEVPEMRIEYVPGTTVEATVNVRVLVAEVEVGENEAVTPVGALL